MTAEPTGYKMIRVRRDRHGWPVGYFDELVTQRIPFPDDARGPDAPPGCLEGLLMNVQETEQWISLVFHDVAPSAAVD